MRIKNLNVNEEKFNELKKNLKVKREKCLQHIEFSEYMLREHPVQTVFCSYILMPVTLTYTIKYWFNERKLQKIYILEKNHNNNKHKF